MVALDFAVRFAGQLIAIPRPGPRSLARVEVQQRSGTLRVFYRAAVSPPSSPQRR